ncbi:fad binding domain-containing protein [Colletotrichum incanum]|uniref:Fad binding domain-containing protein n=1 Tax=Colletotrichum incanum TaxID=1573173 RepID=A0A167BIU8_COLIC|nr:fad binding domain-containing protein [Colletotrichum incanum]
MSSENFCGMFAIHSDEVLASVDFLKRCKEAESDQEKLKELTKVNSPSAPKHWAMTSQSTAFLEMAWIIVSGGLNWHRQDSSTTVEQFNGDPSRKIRTYSIGTPDEKFSSKHRCVATSSAEKEKSARKNVRTRASEWSGCLLYDSSQLCPSQGTRDNKRVS